jgi:hypothetical protein
MSAVALLTAKPYQPVGMLDKQISKLPNSKILVDISNQFHPPYQV